jgi:peptidoglycan-N-acetylglucosamine deacetylase
LIFLGNISMPLMKLYLSIAIGLCKLTKTPISFLLHPLDLIGGDQITQLAFFPGMNVESKRKVEIFKNVIQTMNRHYEVVNMSKLWNNLDRIMKINPI